MSPALAKLGEKFASTYSDEHRRFLRSGGKCPGCGQRVLHKLRFLDASGERMPIELKVGKGANRADFAECKLCGTRWPVHPAERALTQPSHVELIETEREIEEFEVDTIELDNLAGTSPLRQTKTISKEWTRTYEVEGEKTESSGQSVELLFGGGKVGRNADRALRTKYGVSAGEKVTLTDTFEFEVPPRTLREVDFIYSRVWQRGLARIEDGENGVREVPFRVAVDVKLDLKQADKTA